MQLITSGVLGTVRILQTVCCQNSWYSLEANYMSDDTSFNFFDEWNGFFGNIILEMLNCVMILFLSIDVLSKYLAIPII